MAWQASRAGAPPLRKVMTHVPCRYGVTHTLDQVIDAPNIVKHVLNDESGIAQAYVATA